MTDTSLSLFGFALPAFAAVDEFMAASLGPLPRVILWGCLMAALAMLLYRLISPQRKLARIRSEAASARQHLASFDGEFNELMPLVGRSVRLSLQQIAWIFFPALIASLPLINSLVWLDSAYGYSAPSGELPARMTVAPDSASIRATPAAALERTNEGWRVRWPQAGATVTLFDSHGATLAVLNASPGGDAIGSYQWWNALVGNPMGYLPDDSPIKLLKFELAPVDVVGRGPSWMRRWETPFFVSLIVLSILIKVVFKIE